MGLDHVAQSMGGHGSGLAGHGGPMGLWLGQEGPGVWACSMGLCSISPREEGAVTRRFVQKGGKNRLHLFGQKVAPVRPGSWPTPSPINTGLGVEICHNFP